VICVGVNAKFVIAMRTVPSPADLPAAGPTPVPPAAPTIPADSKIVHTGLMDRPSIRVPLLHHLPSLTQNDSIIHPP